MGEEEDKIPQIDVLTNLAGDFFSDEPRYRDEDGLDETYDTDRGEPFDGTDFVPFEDIIAEMVRKSDYGHPCDLMDYFHGSTSIKEKVESAVVSVKNIDGVLYGCTSIQMKEFLDGAELQELFDYVTGQYDDGWGKAFEQNEFPVEGGTLRVHFYQEKPTCILDQIFAAGERANVPLPARTKLKLLGHDGNIFSILGDARRLLVKIGQEDRAKEMTRRVEKAGDYYKALGIISEYVETELSVPPEQKESADKKPRGRGDSR